MCSAVLCIFCSCLVLRVAAGYNTRVCDCVIVRVRVPAAGEHLLDGVRGGDGGLEGGEAVPPGVPEQHAGEGAPARLFDVRELCFFSVVDSMTFVSSVSFCELLTR